MPLAWIHNHPKEEDEKLAIELGVPVQGTLNELRKRLKESGKYLRPTYLLRVKISLKWPCTQPELVILKFRVAMCMITLAMLSLI
jgi:hypothetical protein